MPPVGAYVSALSVVSDRRTALCQLPLYVHPAIHEAHQDSTSSSTARTSTARGTGRCDRCQTSENDAESPARSSPSAQVAMSCPSSGRSLRMARASGTGDREHRAVVEPPNPGHDVAVVEPEAQLAADRHRAAQALDEAQNEVLVGPRVHRVDRPAPTRCRSRSRSRAPASRPGSDGDWRGSRRSGDLPEAVFLVAEQSREDRAGVEPRQAEPVDRSVPADQRRRMGVPDERVVLDALRHPTSRTVVVDSATTSARPAAESGSVRLARAGRGSFTSP